MSATDPFTRFDQACEDVAVLIDELRDLIEPLIVNSVSALGQITFSHDADEYRRLAQTYVNALRNLASECESLRRPLIVKNEAAA